jgi:hypothetical protein
MMAEMTVFGCVCVLLGALSNSWDEAYIMPCSGSIQVLKEHQTLHTPRIGKYFHSAIQSIFTSL